MGHRKRLRQRFLRVGLAGLADYELLELVLTFAIPRRDVKPTAKELLHRFGSLKSVLDASPDQLAGIEGVGSRTGDYLQVLRAAMRRYHELGVAESKVLNSPKAVLELCRSSLEAEKNEVFEVIYVSSKNRYLGTERFSEGTIDRATVHPRRILESAFSRKAAALILVHNHPSGDPAPSEADKRLTKAVLDAAEPIGLTVHDHLIIGNGRHFSFRSEGLLAEMRG
ncbi:MAG: DNA repair protein RadC [Nitrospirae bacterium]|nr:DNA repair protein RadC [Nitrospirota bacterium]